MNFTTPLSLSEIVAITGAKPLSETQEKATGINEIHKVRKGDITFVDHPKYYESTLASEASFVIIDKEVSSPDKCVLFHQKPFEAYEKIIKKYRRLDYHPEMVGSSTAIDPTAQIEPSALIGNHVTVGKNTIIRAGAYIGDYTIIGDNCIIDAGAQVGTEAFYFHKEESGLVPWTTAGMVRIHDHVYIGPATTIARGVSGETVIGYGTKLDAQVQVGHGVVIGSNCLIAAQVGIGGKTHIEDNCTIYGQVGVAQNVRIGKGAVVLGQSGVTKSIEGGKTYFGTPIMEARENYKMYAAMRRLTKS